MSGEKLFSQYEWDENEDEWHKLTSSWKSRAEAAEAELAAEREKVRTLTEERDAIYALREAAALVASEWQLVCRFGTELYDERHQRAMDALDAALKETS